MVPRGGSRWASQSEHCTIPSYFCTRQFFPVPPPAPTSDQPLPPPPPKVDRARPPTTREGPQFVDFATVAPGIVVTPGRPLPPDLEPYADVPHLPAEFQTTSPLHATPYTIVSVLRFAQLTTSSGNPASFFPPHASLSVICIRRISVPCPVFLGKGSEPRHHRPLSNLESMHDFHSYSPRTSALVPPSPPPRHFAKGPPAGGDDAAERGAGLPLRGRQRAGVGRPLVLRGDPPHPRPHADRLGHRRGPTPSCTIKARTAKIYLSSMYRMCHKIYLLPAKLASHDICISVFVSPE